MARVEVTRIWPDGERLRVGVDIENDYPDALREARKTVLELVREGSDLIAPRDES